MVSLRVREARCSIFTNKQSYSDYYSKFDFCEKLLFVFKMSFKDADEKSIKRLQSTLNRRVFVRVCTSAFSL